MARISNYDDDAKVSGTDRVIGTDSGTTFTKNFRISDIVEFFYNSLSGDVSITSNGVVTVDTEIATGARGPAGAQGPDGHGHERRAEASCARAPAVPEADRLQRRRLQRRRAARRVVLVRLVGPPAQQPRVERPQHAGLRGGVGVPVHVPADAAVRESPARGVHVQPPVRAEHGAPASCREAGKSCQAPLRPAA